MAVLVDSSVFITVERRGQGPAVLQLAAPGEPAALATITVSELLTGVYRADTPTRRSGREEFVEEIILTLPVFAFDIVAARLHARIWAELAAAGQIIGLHDLLIASTALAHGYGVLTENLREFERVPGLVVRRPAW